MAVTFAIGGFLLFLAGAIIVITMMDEESLVGAFIGVFLGSLGLTCYIIGLVNLGNHSGHKRRSRNEQITKTCYPYAVTNRHENDGYIVYSCANDNQIRVVKK